MLATSPAAVNSALQRARAGLAGTTQTEVVEPADSVVRSAVDRYVAAFEAADVEALVGLLTADAVLEMPPVPLWYRGRRDYGRFMTGCSRCVGRTGGCTGYRPAASPRWPPTAVAGTATGCTRCRS